MSKKLIFALLLMALTARLACAASNAPLDVESLPRFVYPGPNGVRVTLVRYADQNWTEIDPAVVLPSKDANFKEVCFEAKFDAFDGPTGLKLIGLNTPIYFEDASKRKAAPELKQMDNIWISGTLQPAKDGDGQELTIFEIAQLPPDVQRYENKQLALERTRNAAGLIELGQKIDVTVRNNKAEGLMGYERLITLRDKTWQAAIAIKEKDMRANDPNACYEIALLYRDLLHRTTPYRTWVMKTLELDPDHGNAGKDAENYFKMVRAGDKWMTKDEFDERTRRFEKETAELAERHKKEERELVERREKEILNRTNLLLDYQAALRTSDAAARVGALMSLGDAIKNSADLGFGLSAVDILASMGDDAAIINGMDRASKSDFIEVRQQVYATLVWRASQNDPSAQAAYDVLASALKNEKAKEAAQTASSALAAVGGKNAIRTLIAGLESTDTGVCDALIEGLKKVAQQPLQKKEEWLAWWNANKERIGKS